MTDIWLPLLGGLVLLLAGGEFLVRGAVRLAAALGVSPLVIGVTLVGFGTSTPELVTSVQAALAGSPGIAYGNIIGSNIANILLIGGLSALLAPIAVGRDALSRDAAVMIGVAVAFALAALALPMGRLTGAMFVAALALYLWRAVRGGEAAALPDIAPDLRRPGLPWGGAVIALLGLGAVIAGGTLLVDGAVALARTFAVPETVIGLTIVAVGTSLPELATSLIAALRRQSDMALGNILGSNIYNILGIAGITALIAPGPVPPEMLAVDLPVMIAASAALFAAAWTGLRITRREGALFLAAYAVYLGYLGVAAGLWA